ncbi:MAG: substrate-binding domain-containing protein [Rhodobacteraceae bacterium]|nr:substrate-binding domain-containing protein [Paracoccaceae bacterium]
MNSVLTKRMFAAAAIAMSALVAQPAIAQDVILETNDGSTTIRGELMSFEDGFYTIKTALGNMRLSAERVSCAGDACPELSIDLAEVDFSISGANTIGDELMPLLLEGFAGVINAEADIVTTADSSVKVATLIADQGYGEPFASILVQSSDSKDAFVNLIEGTAEIGMADRRINRDEARALRSAGAGSMIDLKQERVIAVDSLLVLVEESNPVNALTIDQLAGVFAGTITNWKDVGGADMAINVYSFPEESGTETTFSDRVLHPRDMHTKSDANFVNNHIEMSRSIVNDPAGIGYAGYAFQRGAKSLSLISECGINTRPDAFSAKTEEYPLQRRLYVYNRGDATSDRAQEFLDFVTTEAADGLVAKSGFINLGVDRQPQDAGSDRMGALIHNTTDQFEVTLMRQLLIEMMDWDRLSTTFRFASGSTALDSKAQRDLERLITFLEPLPAGSQIAVVGYTDDRGPFSANQSLSETRASHIVNVIKGFAGDRVADIDIVSMGFGEISPADCNETATGRSTNRRVEIWIRDRDPYAN